MAAAADRDPHPAHAGYHPPVGDGAEPLPQLVVEEGLVELAQDLGGVAEVHGHRPDRVAGQGGEGGGLRSLAAHVADDDRPVATRVEDVVEVAADLQPGQRRVVASAEVEAGDVGQSGRQQAGLQGPGQLDRPAPVLFRLAPVLLGLVPGHALAVVQPGSLEGHRRLLGQRHQEEPVVVVEGQLVVEPHDEDADDAFLGRQRDGGGAAAAGAGEGGEAAGVAFLRQGVDPDRPPGAGRLRRRQVGVERNDDGRSVRSLGEGEAQAAALVVEQPQAPAAHRPLGDRLVPDDPHHLVDGEGAGQVAGECLEPGQPLTPLEAVDGEGAQLGDGDQQGPFVRLEVPGLGEAQSEDANRAPGHDEGQGDEALVHHRDACGSREGRQPVRPRREEDRVAAPDRFAQGQPGIHRNVSPGGGNLAVAHRPPDFEAPVAVEGQHTGVRPDRGKQAVDGGVGDLLLRRGRGQVRDDRLKLPELVQQHDRDLGTSCPLTAATRTRRPV